MSTRTTITFRLPKPHVHLDEAKIDEARSSLQEAGYDIELVSEEKYPVSPSWAELAIAAATFTSGVFATHYLEKILDVFDSFVARKIDVLNLCVSASATDKSVYRNISLRDKQAAKEALEEAFFELSVGLKGDESVIYWLRRPTIADDGTISFTTSGWRHSGQWSSLNQFPHDHADYVFWLWLLTERGIRSNLTDGQLVEYKSEFRARHD